ncbi:DUF2147 domain-containing protein [Aquabacter spiritensis]|uniref:Uncharacterized protein (DUF2147 family) n=1 Tax=Aquabacter spiritensis TaxID=933073 RepID=A0A4R3LK23_9HYPH|nr:DUF2147 domain-containing protein [Aquabacter spiritensis]TCT00622.1 uncharacterized protein (DUF2147 family) [Aquabacter spiritensis]
MRSALIAVATLAFLSAPALAADVTGTWLTPTDNGIVEIAPCGASVCGRLVSSDDIKANPALTDSRNSDASQRSRPLKGLLMLQGFTGSGGAWSGGKIYNPDDGKTYSATLTLEGDNTLKVRGCVVVPFCETQTWTRSK